MGLALGRVTYTVQSTVALEKPVVPLSVDKGRSKNPGTNFSVPGHPGTKSLFQKNTKNRKRTFQNRKKRF